jgi:predicted RNA-binding Zn-ribbon protein involved in translation (DUF1610 family)
MISVITNLKQVFGHPRRRQGFFECRHCGTTVDNSSMTCPNCGSQEIARYDLA